MRIRNRGLGIAAACVFIIGLLGCETTRTVESWKDSGYQGGRVGSILVVGLTDNIRRRGVFEDTLVAGLRARGIRAVPSTSFASTKEDLSEETLKRKAVEQGLQGIIVTRLVEVEKQSYYVEDRVYVAPRPYDRRFGTYYGRAYGAAYTPGYWAQYEVAKLETNLYDVATENLIWSAATEAFEPKSVTDVVNSLTKQIVEDLSRSGLI